LTDPFNVSTSGWIDGEYKIQINAKDMAGNTNSSWFLFKVDSNEPLILFNSPGNNSIIHEGVILNFSVLDPFLDFANYSIDGGINISFSEPFNISTIGWVDGNYLVQINAVDLIGNSNSSLFSVTIDNTKPMIIINGPTNNSYIQPGDILDFYVIDTNLMAVNYTINGGNHNAISEPYNISTTAWVDEDYTIHFYAVDFAGNTNSSWFFFSLDSIQPLIILNSPENNSVIPSGIELDFLINDSNLLNVSYSINGGNDVSLPTPYNISTTGWADGDYVVQINALDLAGNFNSSWFLFTIDSTKPNIILNSPGNNSVIPNGTILDFTIIDEHLLEANYSINGGGNISFSDPYNISTAGWPDDDYLVQINTIDMAGNTNSSWYFFTIDSTTPIIQLNSPLNNSFIPSGTILDFLIVDEHIKSVNYSINDGGDIFIFDPFDISTFGWDDGGCKIQINALDRAGNSNSSWFFFTIDSTSPEIILNSPPSNSIVPNGTILNFSIVDDNLLHANYSINGGNDTVFTHPYDLFTSGWPEGDYSIQIQAIDLAGNTHSSLFLFTIDSSPPVISLISPDDNSVIPKGTLLDFFVMDHNLIQCNYSINGEPDIPFLDPFDIPTSDWPDDDYTIQINALDIAGNLTSEIFHFVIDSTKPLIQLNSPNNNSFIHEGIPLDFSVIELNLLHANYSINGEPDISFTNPYNISSSNWPDDEYTIQINAIDKAGNYKSESFFFTIDSTKPTTILNSPNNNSFIQKGTILDFSIEDTNLEHVNYSINLEENITLSEPYTIPTSELPNDEYMIQINTIDLAENSNSSWFLFTLDSTKPEIHLNFPENNTVNKKGIKLNLTVDDINLFHVNYSVNGEMNIPLSEPFNIPTGDWKDGKYKIQINAVDKAGNSNSSWYQFTIDSTKPTVLLNSPENNSIFKNGMILDFTINDSNLHTVQFIINEEEADPFSDPYDIPTNDWPDGEYTIQINAQDLAGNHRSSTFFFTIDSTPPSIDFDPGLNHSIINAEGIIKFNISAEDLESVIYSLDGGEYQPLDPPYIIYPSQCSEGRHWIYIKAKDKVGNEVIKVIEVKIETMPPYILYTNPQKNSMNVKNDTVIEISFSEPMNESNTENHISISPQMPMSFQWNEDGTLLTISFLPNRLEKGKTYCVKIDSQITDLNGNKMGSDFELVFTTEGYPIPQEPRSRPSEPSFPYWILFIVIVIVVILVVLFVERKRFTKLLKKR
jgi:predicted secreted hydrolase